MAADEAHGVTKFNVIVEIPKEAVRPTRLLAALGSVPT